MPKHPETIAVCKYTVKPGKEAEFEKLLARHYPTMSKLGLTAKQPHQLFRGNDHRSKRTVYVELFPWKDEEAPGRAHRMPEVMAIWEPMGALCEAMEFPNVAPFEPDASAR
jgi:hypothetical protein